MQQSGSNNIGLNKLSSAESSYNTSRESSRESKPKANNNKKINGEGRSQNRKARRRSITPFNNRRINQFQNKIKNQHTPSSSRSQSQRSYSRSRSNSARSNKSYYKQTSHKKAWKSKICKYWKKGQCKFGDECEWQHYEFTQIDYSEFRKNERYNKTNMNGQYLVQVTSVQYLGIEEIRSLIGNPKNLKQAIAIAIKNQSKKMKKEIINELRRGRLNEEQKKEMKKKVITKYINDMQKDISNKIAVKRILKKIERNLKQKEQKEKKQQQANDMIPESDNMPEHQMEQYIEPYKQIQDDYYTKYNNQNTYYAQNAQLQNLMQNQNTQQQNNTSLTQLNQINNKDLEESNLYFDRNPQQQNQQIQQQQQIQEKSSTQKQIKAEQQLQGSLIENYNRNQQLQPGRYIINKKNPNIQQTILNFIPKTEEDPLQGTGRATEIMSDEELQKYYDVKQPDTANKNMLIQHVDTLKWTEDIKKGVDNKHMKNRDGIEEKWDESGVMVIKINTQVFNEIMAQQIISKDPNESPIYKLRQAIISAALRYMELKSDYRLQVTSERIDKLKAQADTIWVIGVNKRAKEEIIKDNGSPLCVIMKFN